MADGTSPWLLLTSSAVITVQTAVVTPGAKEAGPRRRRSNRACVRPKGQYGSCARYAKPHHTMISKLFPRSALHAHPEPAQRVLGVAELAPDSSELAQLLTDDPAPQVRVAAARRC